MDKKMMLAPEGILWEKEIKSPPMQQTKPITIESQTTRSKRQVKRLAII